MRERKEENAKENAVREEKIMQVGQEVSYTFWPRFWSGINPYCSASGQPFYFAVFSLTWAKVVTVKITRSHKAV